MCHPVGYYVRSVRASQATNPYDPGPDRDLSAVYVFFWGGIVRLALMAFDRSNPLTAATIAGRTKRQQKKLEKPGFNARAGGSLSLSQRIFGIAVPTRREEHRSNRSRLDFLLKKDNVLH